MSPKILVTSVAVTTVAVAAAATTYEIYRVGPTMLTQQIVRFFLTCLLAFSLIRGWKPARWIAIVLYGIAGVSAIPVGLVLMSRTPLGLLLVIMGIVYIICGVALITRIAATHFNGTPNHVPDPSFSSGTSPAEQDPRPR
jgi:hypothetical protein